LLNLGRTEQSQNSPSDQWFYLAYQCQSCKTEPVRYLVRRHGLRLRICGRDPFEEVVVPDVLPKEIRHHFSSAIVANNAGQTLAAIFFLRVFIEQFFRGIPLVIEALRTDPRLTGDSMGDKYHETLPVDFRRRFPSLPAIYGRLSEAIHLANPDETLFSNSLGEIVEHFEARRVFKLPVGTTS
jgi:hypothetical protein